LLKRWNRENALPDLLVGDTNLQSIGLGERGALVDELLQDLRFDAKLLEQLVVHLGSVSRPVRLKLRLVNAAEFACGDLLAVDSSDRVARCRVGAGAAEEIRDIENDERQADENQAPFEPILVPAHAVEHRHTRT